MVISIESDYHDASSEVVSQVRQWKYIKVAVLGGGSFGTVIANIIAENGFDVYLWMRSEKMARQVNEQRENTQYLPGLN